jgi:hypothetical protein
MPAAQVVERFGGWNLLERRDGRWSAGSKRPG